MDGSMKGLTQQEAIRRLKSEGYNELPSRRRRTLLRIALELVREPMILLLLACGGIYLVLGDLREALLLIGSIGLVIGIQLYQEGKTERALEALVDLSSPRALVIRDGKRIRIPGREVARGDLIVLAEGDRIPADARVLESTHLSVDESLLTGESVPVRKGASPQPRPAERPGGEDLPFVFAGTLAVHGSGVAEVLATGLQTEMGKIGKSLQTIETEKTRLQKEIEKIVRIFAAVGIAVCGLVAVVHGLSHGNWLQGFLAGLTLAISLVPEEFPVVLTVFLALGAWRISRRGVLTRRVPAIEMLGAATVLCTDKTGTLTLNKMQVQRLAGENEQAVALIGVLASHPEPFDPMEKAIHRLRERFPEIHGERGTPVRQYPLTPQRLAMTLVWRTPEGDSLLAAAKGAPEAIAELCRMNPDQQRRVADQVQQMASEGLRVLGVAQAPVREPLPDSQEEIPFRFVGLIGLADPIRPGVPKAIQECHAAGIRVVMITGDYPATARQIAREIGLGSADKVLTGRDLDALDDAALQEQVKQARVFARIVPEQKLRLVNALKNNGEIVAMTGDGVNDAPALKSAHIGIAMGSRGTDVAREAASLVLLNDDFSSMVRAIRLGRRVFDNLRKAMAYLLAVHVPIAGIALIPVLLNWPLVLLPVHIVFLEMIIDPACSIVFEAERAEENVMTRPPRNPREPIFTRQTVWLGLLQGFFALLMVAAIFVVTFLSGKNAEETRAMTFTTMIAANLALILTNRSWTRWIGATLWFRNPALWWVIGGATAVLGLVLYVPWLRDLFRFSALSPSALLLGLAAGIFSVFWFEGMKLIRAK